VHASLLVLQTPILPPISLPPAMGTQVWDLCTRAPSSTSSAESVCTPPHLATTMECVSSKVASPPTTVPNTPTASALLVSKPALLARCASQPHAEDDDSDGESSSGPSSSGSLNHVEGDSDAHSSSPDGDKNVPVYTGVSRSGLNGRWRAQLSTRGRTVHLGTFASAEEAARAWDRAAVQERGKAAVTNFALSDYINADGSVKTEVGSASQPSKSQREDECSRGHKSYRGVYHSGTYGRWKARIVVKGHKIHLGTFASAEDAARAWDLKALEYRGAGTVTNFDPSVYAGGKFAKPREVDDDEEGVDNDEEGDAEIKPSHRVLPSDRKRSRASSSSPTPSELSDNVTPRTHSNASSSPPAKRKKFPEAQMSPLAAKQKAQWGFLGQEEEGTERSKPSVARGAGKSALGEPNEAERMAFSSLMSLCAAAEAMC